MGTKELGWSTARFNAVRFLALTLSVSAVALALPARTAHAADQKKAREKIVEFNKQALLSYEAKDFDTAKDLLTKALKEAKQASLEDDKMTARTYLHLGAVYWVGFKDQTVAVQNFALAKKIRPDIQLTPSIETDDLKSVFDQAVVEPPAVSPTETAPAKSPAAASPQLRGNVDEGGEPDLPTTMAAPLMCSVPDTVPPGKDLLIRCALKPGLNAKVVQVHHRAPGVEAYQVLDMRKTAVGWYVATLPGHMMKVGSLQLYFDARDHGDKEIASNGQVDSPSIIVIHKKGADSSDQGGDQDDPIERIRKQQKAEAYEAGLHRRRAGAFWVGMGGGLGWGYAPAGNLEWARDLHVSAVTTTTGTFHLLPEVGWMYSDDFAFAAQARVEFIAQEQAKCFNPGTNQWDVESSRRPGSPTTKAFAAMGRGIWYTDLSSGGNLRLSLSGDIGGGYVRFPVKPIGVCGYNPAGDFVLIEKSSVAKTDTQPIGPFLIGASGGMIYNISRHFALVLDVRVLSGLPHTGAVVEGGFSAQLAFGGAGPASAGEDGEEGEGEGGDGGDRNSSVNEAPPPPAEPSNDANDSGEE
jgi:hypothetical protein